MPYEEGDTFRFRGLLVSMCEPPEEAVAVDAPVRLPFPMRRKLSLEEREPPSPWAVLGIIMLEC